MDKNIKKLLDSYPSLKATEEGKKLKCCLTGHEMPCRADAIEAYIKGKRFQRLAVAPKPVLEPSVYSEFLLPSNKPTHEKQLFCKLTVRHLNNQPHHIAVHVNGKKFQRAYARWKKCKETGEEFKANIGRTKPRKRDGDDEEREKERKPKKKNGGRKDSVEMGDGNIDLEQSGDDDDTDSLSDLYPVDYFEKLEISAAEHNPMTLNGNGACASSEKVTKSSDRKRKLQSKKKPAVLKTVKAKKNKA